MTKMDDNFKKAVKHIIENGSYDVNPRPYWLNETPETVKAFSDGIKGK